MWISVNSKYSPVRETYTNIVDFLAMCQEAFKSKPVLRYVPNKNCWVDEENETVLAPPSLRDVLTSYLEAESVIPAEINRLTLLAESFDTVRSRCKLKGNPHKTIEVSSDDSSVLADLACWYADDGSGTFAFEVETAQEAANLYCEYGDYNDFETTQWFDVRVWRRGFVLDEDNDVIELEVDSETITVEVHPPEPDCEQDDHDWQRPHSVVGGVEENPGVWGSGGGVKITEVCRHCGHYKTTNTYATNPANGKQGLTSIAYCKPDETSLEWVKENQS